MIAIWNSRIQVNQLELQLQGINRWCQWWRAWVVEWYMPLLWLMIDWSDERRQLGINNDSDNDSRRIPLGEQGNRGGSELGKWKWLSLYGWWQQRGRPLARLLMHQIDQWQFRCWSRARSSGCREWEKCGLVNLTFSESFRTRAEPPVADIHQLLDPTQKVSRSGEKFGQCSYCQ